jgi:AcrR family transcriptional regulator
MESPPKLTRTQKRQKETKERIFNAAMELFNLKGFEETTVAEITEAADIGKGTFFTYFPTKEAIFRQPGELILEKMKFEAQEGLEGGKTLSIIIKNVLTASVEWHESNRYITQQMTKSHFSMDAESSNKQNFVELLKRLIHVGKDRGEFKPILKEQDAAFVLAGTYFMVIYIWASTEGHSLRNSLESSIKVVLEGLKA